MIRRIRHSWQPVTQQRGSYKMHLFTNQTIVRYWLAFTAVLWLLVGCQGMAANAPQLNVTPTPAVSVTLTAVLPTTVPPTAVPPTPAPPTTTPALSPVAYTYRVRSTYPHDSAAFTQGLVWDEGVVYEGTGLNGRSSLRRVDLLSGEVLQQIDLEQQYFGEGIVVYGERIIQLTWRSNVGFVYDKASFALLNTFSYPHEGWGITTDGDRLIVSDGTYTLRFWDPDTLAEIGAVNVHDDQGLVWSLNELEYVDGEVFANVWQTTRIARIDPNSGRVTGWIDLSGILEQTTVTQPVDVLNGIMYDAENGRLFVTGKLWPALFEIELLPHAND